MRYEAARCGAPLMLTQAPLQYESAFSTRH